MSDRSDEIEQALARFGGYPQPKPETRILQLEVRAKQNGCPVCSGTGKVPGGFAWREPGYNRLSCLWVGVLIAASRSCQKSSSCQGSQAGAFTQGSTSQPCLLDLFCGAGGAAMGYHRAGFDVVGVDVEPQPNYPFAFIQEDALWFLRCSHYRGWSLSDFDAIHASPPCQAYTRAGALRTVKIDHPDLIAPIRELLETTGKPWVIENVPGAPLIDPVQLCGTFWKLGGLDWDLQRHRLFEASFELRGVPCIHQYPAISVVGHGATKATRERLGRNPLIAEKRAAMGIDWMNRDELSEAIPPAYTEWVGHQLLTHLRGPEKPPTGYEALWRLQELA